MNIPLEWLEDFITLTVRVKIDDDIYEDTTRLVESLTNEEIGEIVSGMIEKCKEKLND